jgi:hypothetical protein
MGITAPGARREKKKHKQQEQQQLVMQLKEYAIQEYGASSLQLCHVGCLTCCIVIIFWRLPINTFTV